MARLRAAVVGLGQIGMGYDFDRRSTDLVLTHAKAFSAHPGYELVGGLDLDAGKRAAFTERYGAPAFAELEDLFRVAKPDVISLCTNTDTHYSLLREVLKLRPRAIICEKPICYSLEEARELVELSEREKVPVLVNYMRRTEPGAREVGSLLASGAIGSLQKGMVLYSKGLYNNASHFIDLLGNWLGEIEVKQVLNQGRAFPRNDLEPDFVLSCSGVDFSFLALKEECFSVAEVHCFGEAGKISYLEGGSRIELRKTREDPSFPVYRILDEQPVLVKNDMGRYQFYVVDELAKFLDGKVAKLSSGLKDAFLTLKVVDGIRKRAESLGE